MKNCNCNKKPEPVVPCSNPCDRRDHVIKLFVDECSGRPVDPVTVATAVFTEDCKSVQEMLDALFDAKVDLEQKLANLENDTMNVDNHQSLLYRLRSIESIIQDLRNLQSLLGSYTTIIAEINALKMYDTTNTVNVSDLQRRVSELERQLEGMSSDYGEILASIKVILDNNKELFENLLDKLNTGGSGGDLSNYYKKSETYNKSEINSKITTITNSITSLTRRIEEIENTYLKGFKEDNDTFVNNHEILPSVHGILRIDPQAKSGGTDNRSDYAFILKGDITGDGKVDVEDVNAVINIILKFKNQNNYPGDADVKADGKVDVEDVNEIINIILKIHEPEYVIKNIESGDEYPISKNLMYFNTRTNMLCYLQTKGNKVTGLQDVEYSGIDMSKLRGYYYTDENSRTQFQPILNYTAENLTTGDIAIDATSADAFSTIDINGTATQYTFPIVRKENNGNWYRIATITGDRYTCDTDAFIDGGQMTPANP